MSDDANEIEERAQTVLSGGSQAPMDDAYYLARACMKLLTSYTQVVGNLSNVQARCTEMLHNQRTLKAAIQKIAMAGPDERDAAVAEALVVMQAVQ